MLTIEKETDVLTGLTNQRKLFKTLAVLETDAAEKSTGIGIVLVFLEPKDGNK